MGRSRQSWESKKYRVTGLVNGSESLEWHRSLCPRAQVDLAAKWPRRPRAALDETTIVDDHDRLLVHVRAAIAGSLDR
eukprot:scaffold55156_cov63-Phaeocystis_antarctica.AAC.2